MDTHDRLDPIALQQAIDIIGAYVTHGALQDDDQFAAEFDRLWRILPRPPAPLTLYRVLRLPAAQAAELEAGRAVGLRPRRYASWTKDSGALERLVHGRQRPETSLVVMRQEIAAADILLDVADFYERHGLALGCVEEWDRYVRWEREVITRQPAVCQLLPETVVAIEAYAAPTPVPPPMPGAAFTALDGTRDRIGAVLDPGPGHVFAVLTADGDPARVRPTKDGDWLELHP